MNFSHIFKRMNKINNNPCYFTKIVIISKRKIVISVEKIFFYAKYNNHNNKEKIQTILIVCLSIESTSS